MRGNVEHICREHQVFLRSGVVVFRLLENQGIRFESERGHSKRNLDYFGLNLFDINSRLLFGLRMRGLLAI